MPSDGTGGQLENHYLPMLGRFAFPNHSSFKAAAGSTPPHVHAGDWRPRRAAGFSRLKVPQISSWQEPIPKINPAQCSPRKQHPERH